MEAVAHQICDVVDAIESDSNRLSVLRADGGVTVSDLAMQIQADLLGRDVEVADIAEVSALGAAQLAWQLVVARARLDLQSRPPPDVLPHPGPRRPPPPARDWAGEVVRARLAPASGAVDR